MITYQSIRHKVGLEYKDGWWYIYIDDKYRCKRSSLYYAIRALDMQFSIHEAGEYLRKQDKELGLTIDIFDLK
jgi:hypothetical protein